EPRRTTHRVIEFLLQVERGPKIEHTNYEYHQERQCDGEFQQVRTHGVAHQASNCASEFSRKLHSVFSFHLDLRGEWNLLRTKWQVQGIGILERDHHTTGRRAGRRPADRLI